MRVTAASPIVETTRAESRTHINQESIANLPNNGRNFLSFMQLTPGVTIVQGPDGDEISVNGQKGINNNISVDGADFNNPFFGEQRGGQRPAFTFNQDAIKEMVVVADGAAAEFGRSGAGFVNVVTKSGTNTPAGSATSSSRTTPCRRRIRRERSFPSISSSSARPSAGRSRGTSCSSCSPTTSSSSTRPSSSIPRRIEPRVVNFFAALGSPDENGSIDRTNDARVFLGKIDYQLNPSNLFTVRYNYTWSEQENGTFDVDSWGRSANGIERDFSNAVSGSLLSTLSSNMLNEFRFQFAREDRPRPYDGPNVTGQTRPFPDTAFDFGSSYRFGMPFFLPVEYNDTRFQITNNFSLIKGRHTIKVGGEFNRVNSAQTFIGFANGRYIFGSTQGFLNYAQLGPKYVECSNGTTSTTGACPAGTDITGPLAAVPPAGRRRRPVGRGGRHADIPQLEPALFIQDKWQPNAHLTVSYGLRWEAQIQPDLITPPAEVFYAPFIGSPGSRLTARSRRTRRCSSRAWASRGIRRRRQAGAPLQRRDVLRAHPGAEPGQHAVDRRHPRPDAVPRQHVQRLRPDAADLAEPDSAVADLEPGSPGRVRVRQELPEPADVLDDGRATSASWPPTCRRICDLHALRHGPHHAVHQPQRRGVRVSVVHRPRRQNGTNGIATLTMVESSARSQYDGFTFGMNKRYSQNYQFQVNYTLSRDMSDDDNERDPFTFRYARADNLEPEYNYSDRDQRHRFNAWFLTGQGHRLQHAHLGAHRAAEVDRQHAAGSHPARRLDHQAQHAAQGQRVLHVGSADLEGLQPRAA